MKRSITALVAIAGLGALPVAAHADGRSILDTINTEREMAEIAPLTTSSDLNAACSAHAKYMNSASLLTNSELVGSPLYSDAGLWAASHSALAETGPDFLDVDPWKNAPFHEFQLMHPWLSKTGVAVSGNFVCMVTGGDRSANGSDSYALQVVPGTGQYVPPSETAVESPFTPGDEVGLPSGTKTGPNMLVYAVGPQHLTTITITAATLTAADGTDVPVRWVDGSSPRSGKYLDGGAIVIPVHPLEENTSYSLQVEAQTSPAPGETMKISRTSGFLTGPDEPPLYTSPTTNDTSSASSTKLLTGASTIAQPVLLGEAGQPNLQIALSWRGANVRARIHCASEEVKCTGPLRILVHRKGTKIQKLRFKARKGPLRIKLAAGRTINRTVIMTSRQTAAGHKRGFAVRWGGPAPVNVRAS
jgi:hypothetical protein